MLGKFVGVDEIGSSPKARGIVVGGEKNEISPAGSGGVVIKEQIPAGKGK